MKKVLIVLMMAMLLASCTRHTRYGECIGLSDDKKPELVYELSYWNTFLAIFFSETIVVPIVVITSDLKCPVGTQEVK